MDSDNQQQQSSTTNKKSQPGKRQTLPSEYIPQTSLEQRRDQLFSQASGISSELLAESKNIFVHSRDKSSNNNNNLDFRHQ